MQSPVFDGTSHAPAAAVDQDTPSNAFTVEGASQVDVDEGDGYDATLKLNTSESPISLTVKDRTTGEVIETGPRVTVDSIYAVFNGEQMTWTAYAIS